MLRTATKYMKKYYIDEERLRDFEYQDSVINNVDFLLLRISVDGETFYPWDGKIISWERYIDMTTAVLTRKVTWENSKGDITEFVFERFSSFDCDHIYEIKVSITPVNHNKKIEILSGIDTRVKTGGQKITKVLNSITEKNYVYAHVSMGKKYGFETGVTAASALYGVNAEWENASADGILAVKTQFAAEKGKTYLVEKNVYIASSREDDIDRPVVLGKIYDDYYNAHLIEYKKYMMRNAKTHITKKCSKH